MDNPKVKVFETSIVPKGSRLEPVRNQKAIATDMQIEVVHVITFFLIIAFIFAGIWKKAKETEG